MDSVDLEVLQRCVAWRRAGDCVTLATVTRTWGSSPRPVGAMLAMRADGALCGSVSGGCIEDDLIDRNRGGTLVADGVQTVVYGVSAEEARRFDIPCGGTIELVLEPLAAHSAIEELLERVLRHDTVARELDLASGCATLRSAGPGEGLRFDGRRLVTIHGPRYRLLIIGAGQLSRFVAQIAVGLDYEVLVCDPRAEYGGDWDVDGARLLRTMPDDTVVEMRPDRCTAVVALTHDPKLDDLALMEALRSDAFYVGALGSRANNARRRERLKEFDLDDAQLARLHGPIGLPIGSRTPPEIAVSILAHLTAVKNGAVGTPVRAAAVAAAAAGAVG